MRKKKSIDGDRIARYLRNSVGDKATEVFSTIDAQREITTRYIQECGGGFAGEYVDSGKSGGNLNRPGWQQLIADAKEGRFDIVCCSVFDRIARGSEFYAAEKELRQAGVRLVCVNAQWRDGEDGELEKDMKILLSNEARRAASRNTKIKMKEMVANGFVTGFIPVGYNKEYTAPLPIHPDAKKPPQRLIPDLIIAPVIRAAFELFLDCRNYPRVREFLNANAPRPITEKRPSSEWSLQTTINLLNCETYLGVQRFGDWVNESAHEPIISRELWDAVRERAEINTKRFHGTHSDASESRKNGFYLRGLVRCSACGCAMTPATRSGRSGGEVLYYECVSAVKGKSRTCPVRRVNATSLHETVYTEIRRAAETPTRLDTIIRDSVRLIKPAEKLNAELITIQRSIKNKEREINNVVGAIAASKAGRALVGKLTELEAQKAAMEADAARIETTVREHTVNRPSADSVRALWARFGELYRTADDAGKSRLLPLLVEEVSLTEKERGTVKLIFQPNFTASRSLVGESAKFGSGGWT